MSAAQSGSGLRGRIPDCAALHPGYRSPDVRHRPVSRPAPGLAGHPVPHLPRRGVRNDRAFHRARGARMGWHAGSPHAAFAAHGQWPSPTPKIVGLNRAAEADLRLRSAREWTLRLAACPRGCRLRRRAPVRASCRPDMHLDRPPVAPASVPVRSRGSSILDSVRVRHRSGHPHPAATYRRRSRRAPHRSGMAAMILVLQRGSRTKHEH